MYISGVLNLRITSVGGSLIVEWDPASSPYCGGVLNYQVVISLDEQVVRSITTTRLIVTFHNLISDTAYSIMVVAINRAGVGATGITNVMKRGNTLYA